LAISRLGRRDHVAPSARDSSPKLPPQQAPERIAKTLRKRTGIRLNDTAWVGGVTTPSDARPRLPKLHDKRRRHQPLRRLKEDGHLLLAMRSLDNTAGQHKRLVAVSISKRRTRELGLCQGGDSPILCSRGDGIPPITAAGLMMPTWPAGKPVGRLGIFIALSVPTCVRHEKRRGHRPTVFDFRALIACHAGASAGLLTVSIAGSGAGREAL